MELEEKWENTEIFDSEPEKVNGEDAISLTSILLCKKGGIIISVTSGQGYEKGDITQIIDAVGSSTEYHYDNLHRVIASIDCNGNYYCTILIILHTNNSIILEKIKDQQKYFLFSDLVYLLL